VIRVVGCPPQPWAKCKYGEFNPYKTQREGSLSSSLTYPTKWAKNEQITAAAADVDVDWGGDAGLGLVQQHANQHPGHSRLARHLARPSYQKRKSVMSRLSNASQP
jgi:hypothetical protein